MIVIINIYIFTFDKNNKINIRNNNSFDNSNNKNIYILNKLNNLFFFLI